MIVWPILHVSVINKLHQRDPLDIRVVLAAAMIQPNKSHPRQAVELANRDTLPAKASQKVQ